MRENIYHPSIAIHPGKTLQDTLEASNMTQFDLAQRTGLTPKHINEIVQGKASITTDTALKLSSVFGMSANFWNNLQRNYEETLTRIEMEEKLVQEIPLLVKFTCFNELVKWKYIGPARTPKEKVSRLLNFFGVSSLAFVPKVQEIAFRRSDKGRISNECIATWLRCGELDAQETQTQEFDKDKLNAALDDLKKLTRQDASVFPKKIIEICASCGVAVAFVPHFRNTCVNGMTRWLTANKAMIQLSLRGSYEDIFWFTFFHELGHLIKHGKKEQFIEFEDKKNVESNEKEREADEFAQGTLIPKHEFAQFCSVGDFSNQAISVFAQKLNIAPGIVAGRLAHEHEDWQTWSYLRKRLKFKEKDN
ncbi:MAG: HigA family addiction module antitoxin [Candidatus Omnitrophica bacterium]|nr:HigA family addiction module antitoxin [Candidatus Omnitrophota bacterium]